jgi:hypothetical protein
MNDKLMYSFRPQVRKEFAENLFSRLNSSEKGYYGMKTQTASFQLKWQHALIALLLVITIIFGLSPKARALGRRLLDEIAGFSIEEEPENPLKEYFDTDGVLDAPNATIVDIPRTPVDEILADPPFEFSLPEYIPDGMALRENFAAVALSGTWVSINYRGLGIGAIHLFAETGTPTLSVGVDAAEEITLNDRPAMLVWGDWSKDGTYTWDYEDGVTLYWTLDGINYRLMFNNMDNINPADYLPELIKMAESIK